MPAPPSRFERRRPRPGSLERPLNARLYRGTWLLVALPLLVAAFSLARPTALPEPPLPPTFDARSARDLATYMAKNFPDRSPGTPSAAGAVEWFRSQLAQYGFRVRAERFTATIPGRGRVALQNLVAEAPGCSPQAIVVMAHRDNAGIGQGANDNASGTAALIELARAYANPRAGTASGCVTPAHRIVFVSTDGGAFGGLGAEHFAEDSGYRRDVVAVVNLDAIGGVGRPRLEIAGDEPRSPNPSLVATAALRVLEQTGERPSRPSALRQLVDLAFPFSFYEQAAFVARGVPAVTLTSAGDRPPDPFGDTPDRLDLVRIGEIGKAAQELVASLDQGLELARGTSSYVYFGPRLIRGWAIELVLIAALLPFVAAAIDLFARCRRRRIALGPALRSYRTRLAFWLSVGLLFWIFGLLGAWPDGAARPPSPESGAATHWPVYALAGFLIVTLAGWLVARDRLAPRRRPAVEEELAGHVAALLALGVVALVVVGTNPFALVFLLPSLHAWIWLPQLRDAAAWKRVGVLTAGFAGPLLLLWSFGTRYGLGLDGPWYALELAALGYVSVPAVVVVLGWAAGAAQLLALAGGRYAPYPTAAERPRLGPLRRVVRAILLLALGRHTASEERRRALGGS
jgi:hypothetical protein